MINNLLKKDMLPPDRLKFVLNTLIERALSSEQGERTET